MSLDFLCSSLRTEVEIAVTRIHGRSYETLLHTVWSSSCLVSTTATTTPEYCCSLHGTFLDTEGFNCEKANIHVSRSYLSCLLSLVDWMSYFWLASSASCQTNSDPHWAQNHYHDWSEIWEMRVRTNWTTPRHHGYSDACSWELEQGSDLPTVSLKSLKIAIYGMAWSVSSTSCIGAWPFSNEPLTSLFCRILRAYAIGYLSSTTPRVISYLRRLKDDRLSNKEKLEEVGHPSAIITLRRLLCS